MWVKIFGIGERADIESAPILKQYFVICNTFFIIRSLMKKTLQKKISETDLSKPVSEYFENLGYTVHCEVKSCDITAIKDEELIIVELKLGFNIQLLYQATQRQCVADKVYVAIPRPPKGKWSTNWDKMCHVLRRLELGLIIVHFKTENPVLEVVLEPEPFEIRRRHKGRKDILKEASSRYINYNEGGSVGRKLMTAYKDSSIHIACCLEKYGPLTTKRLIQLGTCEKTYSILTRNFNGWFEKISKGVYSISQKGKIDIEKFSELAEVYRKLMT
jgi:hypothetical protein